MTATLDAGAVAAAQPESRLPVSGFVPGEAATPAPPASPAGWSGLLATEREVLRHLASLPWALLAACFVALWIPLKMLRVAHGDTTTALAVLEAADKATVVAGVLIQLLPSAVLLAWAWCCLAAAGQLGRISAAARGRGGPGAEAAAKRALLRLVALVVPGALLGWLAAAAVSWPATAAAAACVTPLAAGGYWLARRGRGDSDGPSVLPQGLRDRPVRVAIVATAAVGLLVLAVADLALTGPLNDRVWLPPRAVTTGDGTSVVYVLRDDGDQRTVLSDAPREVLVLDDSDVGEERLCAPGGRVDSRSLWDLAKRRGRGGTVACPGS